MDLRKLKKLIDLVEESGIAELEITEGEEKVRISRNSIQSGAIATVAPVMAAPRRPVPRGPAGSHEPRPRGPRGHPGHCC